MIVHNDNSYKTKQNKYISSNVSYDTGSDHVFSYDMSDYVNMLSMVQIYGGVFNRLSITNDLNVRGDSWIKENYSSYSQR